MIHNLITEASEHEFKEALEVKKPRSWLKTVSAFANSVGGFIIFGLRDDAMVLGLHDASRDAQIISRLIKERITPLPSFTLSAFREGEKDLLTLTIDKGATTPYYYRGDGKMEAFIRIGNESIVAPALILNELIMKGTHQSFDALITKERKADYSFSLLEATFLQRTKTRFQPTDYESFGLTDADGYLTNAGRLMADQPIVFNGRLFCTRWNGLRKGSIFDDAVNDREYKGNLITLLQNGQDFVRSNTAVRFKKEAIFRVDKPDYSDRAVEEALINALIHRDYTTLGAEVNIDIYDDRLVIHSPGGMWDNTTIQNLEIDAIKSVRRNPVLADLFQRMQYMERRGSGIEKIIRETSILHGYDDSFKPEFRSTRSDFMTIFKNMNYEQQRKEKLSNGVAHTLKETMHDNIQDTPQETPQDTPQDTPQVTPQDKTFSKILEFCIEPKTRREIAAHLGLKDLNHLNEAYLKPLITKNKLALTLPNKPTSRNQMYFTVKTPE